jgi:hypothetical protein
VEDSFTLLDPHSAQRFLKSLPSNVRRKGEALLQGNFVQNLAAEDPGIAYTAYVLDGTRHQVSLHYDADDEWESECSCREEFNCEHVYAAMSALLAEHRTATVRSLSSSAPGAAAALAASRPRSAAESGSDLARLLTITLGRRLNPEEVKFLQKVHAVFVRCSQSRHFNGWDFCEMGFRLEGYGWDGLKIWPAFPANEHEFWLYVANCAQEQKLAIPEFMLPVTDLSGIKERMNRWRRSQEIETWKQRLGRHQLESVRAEPESQGETDLRVVVSDQELRLQCLRPAQTEWEPLRRTHFRQFSEDYDAGKLRLTKEAELLWNVFSYLYLHGIQTRYEYFIESQASRLISRLLRTRELDSKIVNWQGQPLARPAEPLSWDVQPATEKNGDYRLRLLKADGTPAPSFLCILPGKPTLYLNRDAVFTGPCQEEALLDPTSENLIPAPALESSDGVSFLQSLGAELPERIRARTRLLPYEVAIDFELRPIQPESKVEECIVTVLAEAPDGHRQSWEGHNWTHSRSPVHRKDSDSKMITVYDRTVLDAIPRLLEPLNLKCSTYHHELAIRVTKKFPEVLSAWIKTVPPHIIVRLNGELASLATGDVSGRVKLDATEAGIDWFDLRVVLDVSDTTLTPGEIKLLLNAKGGYVRLQGKGWRRLQYDLSDEENERLSRLGLSPHELSAEPQRLHALQLSDDAAKSFLPEGQVKKIQRRAEEIKTRVVPDVPAGVTAQLRPYQLHGFHFLAYLSTNRFGGILADDMGLGKTVQTLAWLVWLRELEPAAKNGGRPSLVVCPKSVMDNWHAEAARFTPGLRVKVWLASEVARLIAQLGSADLHVINYNQLRLLGDTLKHVHWLSVILDEGQYIKNPNSQTAQVARALSADHRLVLSGTPIENRLLDLWSLMTFAMPGVLSSRTQFARMHDAKGDPFARRRLSARVRPFVLRRTKSQVAKDLPDRIEEDLFCEIEGEQQTLYRAELKAAQQLLLGIKTQKELAKHQFHFLTSLLRLRQICCDPRLMKPDSTEIGAKTEALLDVLEPIMEEGQKVLVFSQFVEMLHLLQPVLAAKEWPLFYLAGETENRGALVQKFQTTQGPAIFLISLKAGGFGLNLTAASYVVLFDPWWNPAVENQAIDRTHRIGQNNKVIAYRLLIKNSIEEKIRELQKQKKALADDVLGEEKFAQSLTLNDLQFLFAA